LGKGESMKVSELIEQLKYFDGELEVEFIDNNGFAENCFRIIGDCYVAPDNQDYIMSNHHCITNNENYYYPHQKSIGYGNFIDHITHDEVLKTYRRCCLINVQLGY